MNNRNKTSIQLIIDGCIKENPISQQRLFELKYSFVMSICRRYGNNPDEAKEMLNDSYYTLFKYIHRYNSNLDFDAWFRKITVNCCLQHKRKYFKNQDKIIESIENLENELVSENINLPNPDEYNYMNLLNHLPEACKVVINLFVIEGYKHREIAELLNISEGTSKSNLSRAKRLLYETLERDSKSTLKLKSKKNG